MASEEYTIRINRKGEVFIEAEGLTPEKLRDLAAYLQETMGPVRIESTADGGGPGARVEIDDLAGREEAAEEAERDRLRIRGE